MTYEIKDNPVHGKMLAKDGKIIITDHNTAMKLAERFNAQLVKSHSNRYMIQLPYTAKSIEECDCQSGQLQPDTYNQYPDHEVQMARQELYRTAKLAIMTHELLKQVGERQGLEGWVQSKLTRAADYIETVFDYLDYEMRYPSEMYSEDTMNLNPGASAQATPGTTPAGQQGLKPGQAPIPPADGKTQTPGMVKMAKVDMNGKIQGVPIMVPQTSIKSKQQAGFRVVGESATGGASSAGGMASSTGFGNGFLNGGPGAITRRPKKKKTTTEAWDMLDPGKPYGLANPRILTVGDDPQGIADFAVTGKNVLGIRPFNTNQWNNTQQDARNHGYMLKYTGTNKEKAIVANSGVAPRLGRNMRGDKLEGVAEAGNPARQAATAIAKKKSGKYDKDGKRIKEANVEEGWKGAAAGAALLGLGAMGAGGQAQAADMNKAGVSNMKAPTQATHVAKQEQLKRYPTDPRPDLKLGSLEDMFFNGNTNHDREIRYLNYQTDSSAEGMTPQQWSDAQGPKNSPMKTLTPDQQAARKKLPLRTANWTPDDDKMPATIEGQETGPKFTGYYKGTDKGKPGKKMVGDA